MILELFFDVVEQGLIFSLPVMAVFLTSKVLGFDDLTVEGSFGIGGAAMSCMLLMSVNPWLAFLLCGAAGALLGGTTALLHTRLGIVPLISGVCVTTGVFSLNLWMAGANIPLQGIAKMFTADSALVVLVGVVVGVLFALSWLLQTEVGLFMRTCGRNPSLLCQLGGSTEGYILLTLSLANLLTALSGALFVQWVGFFSITGSVGTLIIALAGLILSGFFSERCGVALIVGAILYQSIFALTISLGVDPVFNNLLKALFIVGLLHTAKRRLLCLK